MKINKLTILIPAYNEENTIYNILERISEVSLIHDIKKEIIVINDCSKDDTEQKVFSFKENNPEINIKYYKHEKNRGKGAAIHTGIKEATGEYFIIQDADLEYDPEEFNLLLVPVFKGEADVVYGTRFNNGKPHRVLFFWHTIGNKILTNLSNMFTNWTIGDMETCYKLVNTKIVQNINLKEKRFGFEPELTAKLAKIKKLKVYEVGISYYGRTYEEGKKINWKDGFRAIYCIFKYNLFSK